MAMGVPSIIKRLEHGWNGWIDLKNWMDEYAGEISIA